MSHALHYNSTVSTYSGITVVSNAVAQTFSTFHSQFSIAQHTDQNQNIVDSLHFDPWGNRKQYSSWNVNDIRSSFLFNRGFTGHEHLDEFKIINMNGRIYDPVIGRFFSPDPYVQMPDFTQNFNRYSYCFNNPLSYTDPDGEFVWAAVAIGAAIGGVMNVATNWKNIDGFWQGLASFGAGAGSGALTAAFGPWGALAGGAITGATNSLISQTGKNFSGFNNVNWGQVGLNAGVGGIAGIAGYGAGQWASNNIGNVLINGFNIASPVLKGAISGAIGGAAGGYAGGFVGGYIMTGDASLAHQSGMNGLWMGMGIGAGTGAISGYMAAKNAGLNPWTGKSKIQKPSIVLGRDMDNRVNPAAKDLGAKTISEDWNNHFGKGTDVHHDKGLPFNENWLKMQLDQQVKIYNIGPGNALGTSIYYNMEMNMIKSTNYQNVTPAYYYHYRDVFQIIYYK